jgi:hypothetical protein
MKGNGKPTPKGSVSQVGGKLPGLVIKCPRMRGFTKIEFSEHALQQMKIRGITQGDVLNTISNPAKTGLPTPSPRKRFRRYISNTRSIDVVFEDMKDRMVVVTAMKVSLKTRERPDRNSDDEKDVSADR